LLRISTAEAIRFEDMAKMAPPIDRESGSPRGKGVVVATAADRPSSSEEPGRGRRIPRK
jgi:hypothetical protein